MRNVFQIRTKADVSKANDSLKLYYVEYLTEVPSETELQSIVSEMKENYSINGVVETFKLECGYWTPSGTY